MTYFAANGGGTLIVPPAVHEFATQPDAVPGSVQVLGLGWSYSTGITPTRGSILRATAAMSHLVKLGSTTGSSNDADASASVANLIIDGGGLADSPLVTAARRNRVHEVYVRGGAVRGILWNGQNGLMSGYCVVDQGNVGDCLLVTGDFSYDNTFDFGKTNFRSWGDGFAGVRFLADGSSSTMSNVRVIGGHAFKSDTGAHQGCIVIEANGKRIQDVFIDGFEFDGAGGGPPLLLLAHDTNSFIRNVSLTTSNGFMTPDLHPDLTWSLVEMEGAGYIYDLNVSGNKLRGYDTDARYRSFVHDRGTGGRGRVIIDANGGIYVDRLATRAAGAQLTVEVGRNAWSTGSAGRRSHDTGAVTINGDGSTKRFAIPTATGGPVARATLSPTNAAAAAAGVPWLDTTETGSTVWANYATAPTNGTTLTYQWFAETAVREEAVAVASPASAPTLTSLFVNDTLTDANDATLTPHVGETGATWAKNNATTGAKAWLTFDNANRIYRKTYSSSDPIAVYNASGQPGTKDYGVQADYAILSNIAGQGIGIIGRASLDDGYGLYYVNGQWRLQYHRTDGTGVVLATYDGSNTVGQTYTGLLLMRGTTITAYVDGTKRMEVEDTRLNLRGQVGFWSSTGASNTVTQGVHMDNFKAGLV